MRTTYNKISRIWVLILIGNRPLIFEFKPNFYITEKPTKYLHNMYTLLYLAICTCGMQFLSVVYLYCCFMSQNIYEIMHAQTLKGDRPCARPLFLKSNFSTLVKHAASLPFTAQLFLETFLDKNNHPRTTTHMSSVRRRSTKNSAQSQ